MIMHLKLCHHILPMMFTFQDETVKVRELEQLEDQRSHWHETSDAQSEESWLSEYLVDPDNFDGLFTPFHIVVSIINHSTYVRWFIKPMNTIVVSIIDHR